MMITTAIACILLTLEGPRPTNVNVTTKTPIEILETQIGKTKVCNKCNHKVPTATTLNEKQREYVYSLAVYLEKGEKARPGSTTSRSYVRGLTRLSFKESTHSTLGKNPRSTASGLFGFLDSTWKGTGFSKTQCPICQTRAAYRYCVNRYKSIDNALAFHKRRGYY